MDVNKKILEIDSQAIRNLEDYKPSLKLLLPIFIFVLGETESAHTGRSEPQDSLQENTFLKALIITALRVLKYL